MPLEWTPRNQWCEGCFQCRYNDIVYIWDNEMQIMWKLIPSQNHWISLDHIKNMKQLEVYLLEKTL